MIALSVAFRGIDAILIEIQVKLITGLPNFTIVGLPDKVIAESRERVKSAINSMGLAMPLKKIVVNLSPADITKEGSHYDLPIALGLLAEIGVIPQQNLERCIIMGELSLDGDIVRARGVLPAADLASRLGYSLICPYANGGEALLIDNITILSPQNLLQLINFFRNQQELPTARPIAQKKPADMETKLSDVRGHELAKRACVIAIAGKHNMLMIGSPGSGKSMLASRMANLMPPMSYKEALEVNIIKSISGENMEESISLSRPYRAPHHICSTAAMAGGGKYAKPGEISLAHNGILFLDELPEFSRSTMESLRQPMESRNISIARTESHITYPANFQLIAAMNPCRCGYANTPNAICNNHAHCVANYMSKISGPVLDRIDIVINMEPIDILEHIDDHECESDEVVKNNIIKARGIQAKRLQGYGIYCNAEASWSLIQKYALPKNREHINIVRSLAQKRRLSTRAVSKIFQVARTIADLEESADVELPHIAESVTICARNNTSLVPNIDI